MNNNGQNGRWQEAELIIICPPDNQWGLPTKLVRKETKRSRKEQLHVKQKIKIK